MCWSFTFILLKIDTYFIDYYIEFRLNVNMKTAELIRYEHIICLSYSFFVALFHAKNTACFLAHMDEKNYWWNHPVQQSQLQLCDKDYEIEIIGQIYMWFSNWSFQCDINKPDILSYCNINFSEIWKLNLLSFSPWIFFLKKPRNTIF